LKYPSTSHKKSLFTSLPGKSSLSDPHCLLCYPGCLFLTMSLWLYLFVALVLPLFQSRNMKYSLVIIGLVLQASMLPTTLALRGVSAVGAEDASIEYGGRMYLMRRDLCGDCGSETMGGSSTGTMGGSSTGTMGGSSTGTMGGSSTGTMGGSSTGTMGGSSTGTMGGSSTGTMGGSSTGGGGMSSSGSMTMEEKSSSSSGRRH
jgi:hypothetical protein